MQHGALWPRTEGLLSETTSSGAIVQQSLMYPCEAHLDVGFWRLECLFKGLRARFGGV